MLREIDVVSKKKSFRSEVTPKKDPIEEILERIVHWLPSQGPIKDFIHHNTLHAFQERQFHEGLIKASELYGSRGYLSANEYRDLYAKGEIKDKGIQFAIDNYTADKTEQKRLRKLLFENFSLPEFPGVAKAGVRSRWLREKHLALDSLVHPVLFRLLSNYLDQGVAIWRMPHADKRLWEALGQLVEESFLPVTPFGDREIRPLFKLKPKEAIAVLLEKIVGNPAFHEAYLLEMLLNHAGWSGMIHMAEKQPETLVLPRPIFMEDAVAVELMLEYAFALRNLGEGFAPLVNNTEKPPTLVLESPVNWTLGLTLQKLWQEAYEWSYYESVLETLVGVKTLPKVAPNQPMAQLFFCIDDRECSLRRYLEEENPRIKTWGAPGFFGIDWLYQSSGSDFALKLCPAPVKPRHLVVEKGESQEVSESPKILQLLHLAPSNTLVRGWLVSQVLGVWHGLKLAWEVFLPSRHRPADQSISHIEPKGTLQILREGDKKNSSGLYLGFSLDEMADRVYSVLNSIGCVSNFSELLIFVSHGASSVNNPYFAAYDCGACSGRPGAPNARAFAWMANDPRVRKLVSERGIQIPDSTYFVGAFHDTTRDEVMYFLPEDFPQSHRKVMDEVRNTMERALENNAAERCRRFELANIGQSPKQALQHVRERAASIFEPRPELNHANNALCIVGRHEFTHGVFLDRRAFLNSYNPLADKDGSILAGILGAAVPVCGGINLEYYFSRVDSDAYGAGTKLPHNVVGLVGVANGVEGDLLTGLPTQMTELHDPVRLLMVVEQEPEIVLRAVQANPVVWQWVKNHWVRFSCVSPSTGEVHFFKEGRFEPVSVGGEEPLRTAKDSKAVIAGKTGNIPPCFIGNRKKS